MDGAQGSQPAAADGSAGARHPRLPPQHGLLRKPPRRGDAVLSCQSAEISLDTVFCNSRVPAGGSGHVLRQLLSEGMCGQSIAAWRSPERSRMSSAGVPIVAGAAGGPALPWGVGTVADAAGRAAQCGDRRRRHPAPAGPPQAVSRSADWPLLRRQGELLVHHKCSFLSEFRSMFAMQRDWVVSVT